MKHIKFTIDITLPPDKEFLTKKDFMEAVYTCYGNIRDVNPNTIKEIRPTCIFCHGGGDVFYYEDVVKQIIFIDGTPFGIKEEE